LEPPGRFVFVGTHLEAQTLERNRVWGHEFDRPVSKDDNLYPSVNGAAAVIDLDGDGTLESVVPVRFALPGERPTVSDVLYAFDADGTVRWTVDPPAAIHCSGESFRGPWRIYSVAVSSRPGPVTLWVAYNHHTWWPGIVLRVSSTGKASVQYLQTGWISALAFWPRDGRPRLIAAGVSNEHNRPSVVALNLEAAPAITPHHDRRFDCLGLPTDEPDQLILLPNHEIGAAGRAPYSMVEGLVIAEDTMKLTLEAGGASEIVELNSDLRVTSISFSDRYWAVHGDLEQRGILNHSASTCPFLRAPVKVDQWTRMTGWHDIQILPTLRSQLRKTPFDSR
jgi:hypothetical protein